MKTLTALEREAFTAGLMAAMLAWGLDPKEIRDGWVDEQFFDYLARRRHTCKACSDKPPEAHLCTACGRIG